MQHIYIDDGSTNIKLAWLNEGKVEQFISANSFKRELSFSLPGMGNSVPVNFECDGYPYSYDEVTPQTERTTETRYQYSDINVVAIHRALHAAGLTPGEISVTVTLPLSEYLDSSNQPNKANIDRKKASVKRAVEAQNAQNFVISKVKVLPESIPAGVDVLHHLNTDESMLIVDLGGTTLDISQVKGRMTAVAQVYCDPLIGVSMVTNAISNLLAGEATPLKANAHVAEQLLISYHTDKSYLERVIHNEELRAKVVKRIQETEKALCKRVLDAISRFSMFSHVMCVGGGAHIVANAVKEATAVPDANFHVSDNVQFDLVLGMLTMQEGLSNDR